jgi:hypothetical protein
MGQHSQRSLDMLHQATAREVAERERIPYAVALERVRTNGKITLAEMKRRTATMPSALPSTTCAPRQVFAAMPLNTEAPKSSATVPPLPREPLPDARAAREYLSKCHPGWDRMSLDDKFRAALAMRDLSKDRSLLLSADDQRPVALLCVWGGATPAARAIAFLSATDAGFSKLTYDQQFARAVALSATHNVIDLEG